jgi:SulP family sulfate permease
VITSFTAEPAILMAIIQLSGCPPRGESSLYSWLAWYREVDGINLYVLGTAVITLVIVAAIRVTRPRWPNMSIAMPLGRLLTLWLDGCTYGVHLIGAMSAHMPPLSPPELTLDTLRELALGEFAIALLGSVEPASIPRTIAPARASFLRSERNTSGSCRCRAHSTGCAATRRTVTAYLLSRRQWGSDATGLESNRTSSDYCILRTDKGEKASLLTTCLATFFESGMAIYAGVLVSLVLCLNRESRLIIVILAPDSKEVRRRRPINIERKPFPECPQLKIARIDRSLFFGEID